MPAHDHGSGAALAAALPVTATLAVLVVMSAYLYAAVVLRRRGDRWPVFRTAACVVSGTSLIVAALVPLPGSAFTVHMIQHTIVGMTAPVFFALARPITLALRALPPGRRRRALLRVVHSRAASIVVFPPLAALLDVGGLWLLYRTGLFTAVHDKPILHGLVYTHVFAAGLLFAIAVTQLEPVGRRYSFGLRAASLVLAAAAHDVLSKYLYATPPPGAGRMFDAADLHLGAQVMYYGGDVTEVMLALTIGWQWYGAAGRAHARTSRAHPLSREVTTGTVNPTPAPAG